jgi:hypothetical protein
MVSSPGEFHPQALSEPDLRLSPHPAPIIQPQEALFCPLVPPLLPRLTAVQKLDNTIPSLHAHYRHFVATTNCSAPAQCIDTFVLMGPPLGVFS